MIKKRLGIFLGQPFLQPLWESLHKFTLRRMNFGRGANPEKGGERWVLDFIKRRMAGRPSIVVFDVGAHVGDYAAAAIKSFGKNAVVYCFEPAREVYGPLKLRFEGSGNVNVYNFGFSDRAERCPLYTNKEEPSLASLYRRDLDHHGIAMTASEEIELKKIDEFCAQEGIGHIDFLKLDVEGHELKVLEGALGLLSRQDIDFIQFEFGDCNIDSRTYFRDFFSLLNPNYRIYRVLREGLRLVARYNERLEIFKVTNYLAVSRKIGAGRP